MLMRHLTIPAPHSSSVAPATLQSKMARQPSGTLILVPTSFLNTKGRYLPSPELWLLVRKPSVFLRRVRELVKGRVGHMCYFLNVLLRSQVL